MCINVRRYNYTVLSTCTMYVYNKVLELTYGGDTPIYSSGNLQWQVLSHVTIHILADVGEWVFPCTT